MMTVEQMMNAHRANVETLFGLGSTAFAGMEQFVELNVQATKLAMNDAAVTTQALLAVKDPQEFVAVQAGFVQPAAEKFAAYGRSVYEIAATTGAEVGRVAEATVSDAQGKFMAVVDNAVKNAPAGTENAVALVRGAVSAMNNAYESASKAAKQAADVTDANLKAMSATAVRATTKARRAA